MSKDLARHLMGLQVTKAEVMAISVADAKARIRAFGAAVGCSATSDRPLLTTNYKLEKTGEMGLCLLPADASGEWNTCRYATDGCRDACVLTHGRGAFATVIRGRLWKTQALAEDTAAFLRLLVHEISKLGDGWGVRLNTASDLPWEHIAPWLFEMFPAIRFYDYTKWSKNRLELPNYRQSFSISERQSLSEAVEIARAGGKPVVVVNRNVGEEIPSSLDGVPVEDGDVSDDRFGHVPGTVVVLRRKGSARNAPVGDAEFVKAV